jgi:ABC-type Na+ transport system ATPase subunit NatA
MLYLTYPLDALIMIALPIAVGVFLARKLGVTWMLFGAGKTTAVRLLTSLIAPTSGRASVNGLEAGRDDDAIRQCVDILTETPGMYDRLSAEEKLKRPLDVSRFDDGR